jgi:hypothetical protein
MPFTRHDRRELWTIGRAIWMQYRNTFGVQRWSNSSLLTWNIAGEKEKTPVSKSTSTVSPSWVPKKLYPMN